MTTNTGRFYDNKCEDCAHNEFWRCEPCKSCKQPVCIDRLGHLLWPTFGGVCSNCRESLLNSTRHEQ